MCYALNVVCFMCSCLLCLWLFLIVGCCVLFGVVGCLLGALRYAPCALRFVCWLSVVVCIAMHVDFLARV